MMEITSINNLRPKNQTIFNLKIFVKKWNNYLESIDAISWAELLFSPKKIDKDKFLKSNNFARNL